MNFYKEDLLDHYQNPRNAAALASYTHRHLALNPMCGDKVEVFVQCQDNAIKNIAFVSSGCVLSTAAASKFSLCVKNLSIQHIQKLDHEYMINLMGMQLGINRMQCILLPLQALKAALEIKKD